MREAETELGIAFPEEYREHLLRVSAGGEVRRLYRSTAGWGRQDDSDTNHGLLTTPFPHPDSYRAHSDDLDAREPREEDFPDYAAHQEAWRIWDAECGVFEEHRTAGAVFVQENGCGFSTLLVVTGPYRGTMWFDARATCDRILPLRLDGQAVTFADWLGRNSTDLLEW